MSLSFRFGLALRVCRHRHRRVHLLFQLPKELRSLVAVRFEWHARQFYGETLKVGLPPEVEPGVTTLYTFAL